MKPTRVGVVGCGNISDIYFTNMTKVFGNLEVVSCADVVLERAQEKAEKYGIPQVYQSGLDLVKQSDAEIVVNLTTPPFHTLVNTQALEAGKHVYVEKPMAVTREDGQKVLDLARKNGLLVGCAPDTFLGAGIQTCRKLIEDGWIGEPVAATAFMLNHGHESWHPDPEFYYKTGGGPMFDMGPYYLTALINLMGPVKRVSGSARITFPERTITSEPKHGQVIEVEVPTHIAGTIDFQSGAIGTIITSFDVWGAQLPRIEVYGTRGSLNVPDPNTFGGPVFIRQAGSKEWKEMPLSHPNATNSRGLGVSDMAAAIKEGRKHRASGELGYHVLEVMHGFHDASKDGRYYELKSTCEKPEPLPE